MQFEPGAVLGKYHIIRPIGRGGVGVVLLAEDQNLARKVALKILDRNLTCDDGVSHQLRHEARTIAALKHPNIVPIHSLEKIGDDLVIDMEYVEGGTLASVNATTPELLQYIRDILEALECCHMAGIVHRDVKPGNILISARKRALLSDFGLSRLLVDLQMTTMLSRHSSAFFVGTPLYAPPEAWEGAEASPAWDVYSTGVVLYEAISGRLPFHADTPLALLKKILEQPVPPLAEVAPGISPALSGLVDDMLRRDPAERPGNAGDALNRFCALPEATGEHPLARRTISLPTHAFRLKQRLKRGINRSRPAISRAGSLVLGALLLALLGAISYSFAGRKESAAGPFAEQLVFDSVNPGRQELWEQHVFMLPTGRQDSWTALAARGTQLWLLEFEHGEFDGLDISGEWAEYTDNLARFFRSGTLKGNGRWLSQEHELVATLDFTVGQDGTTWSMPLLLRRSSRSLDLAEYAQRVRMNDHLQALLYNELLPRGAAWVETVEKNFLDAQSSRATVSWLGDSISSFVLDGRLDEDFWHRSLFQDGADNLPPTRSSKSASMRLRYGPKTLLLGLRFEALVEQPVIVVSLLNRFDIPVRLSPRWVVQFGEDRSVGRKYGLHRVETPWQCGWEQAFASRMNERGATIWEAEIVIPFENLSGPEIPGPLERWRMNCQLMEAVSGTPSERAGWGAENPEETETGILLVFGAR